MPELFSTMNVNKVLRHELFKLDYKRVKALEYIDAEKRSPMAFRKFRERFPILPPEISEVPRPTFEPNLKYLQSYSAQYYPKGKFVIVVNEVLLPRIRPAINQYVLDVANDGYYAQIFQMRGESAEHLRSFLRGRGGICGALLVGHLPVAWFEMDDDFYGAHSEFPSDLYFMDLNGTWTDPDNDGKFSVHPTNVAPEIFVSRLWTPTEDGNDAALINDYFARNHQFRKGLLGTAGRGLAYVDDDWQGFGDCAIDLAMGAGTIDTFTQPVQTDADKYKAELDKVHAWAQVCAHSSPFGHSFKIPGASSEWIPNSYFRDINAPNAFFCNLFACSSARFVENDYVGGWYLFDKAGRQSRTMAVVGSTKTGSMLYFENFYQPMATGSTVGEAYKAWWNGLGPDHDLGERQWFYGMTLLGDPLLNLQSPIVPQLQAPDRNEVFDHYPRELQYRWSAVDLPGVTYTLQVDYYYGKWASEVGNCYVYPNLTQTSFTAAFVGAQPGRWRVQAKLPSGLLCPFSDWRYFRCTR